MRENEFLSLVGTYIHIFMSSGGGCRTVARNGIAFNFYVWPKAERNHAHKDLNFSSLQVFAFTFKKYALRNDQKRLETMFELCENCRVVAAAVRIPLPLYSPSSVMSVVCVITVCVIVVLRLCSSSELKWADNELWWLTRDADWRRSPTEQR